MATKKTATKDSSDGWTALKSGAMKNGIWFASQYAAGWYFVAVDHNTLGPYKTFQDGLKDWNKLKK